MKKCTKCQQASGELDKMTMLESSCNHLSCSRCFYKEVIYNYEKIMNCENKNEKIQIKCLLCDTGNYSCTNNNIHKILIEGKNCKEKNLQCEGDCVSNANNSQSIAKFYCKNCNKYLCMSCLMNSHSEHNFTNNNNIHSNNFCTTHEDYKLELECFTCATLICYVCREKNHKDHDIKFIKEDFIDKVEKIKSNFPLNSYEKFCKNLEEEKEEIFERLKLEVDARIDTFEKLISTIQDNIHSFKDEIHQLKEKLEISVENMKMCFEGYYNDLQKIKSDDYFNAFLLGKISNQNFDFNLKDRTYSSFNNYYKTLYYKIKNLEKEILPFKIDYDSGPIRSLDNVDVKNFNKICSYQIDGDIISVLKLDDEKLAVWTETTVELIKYSKNQSCQLEFIKSYEYTSNNNYYAIPTLISRNNHIVFTNAGMEIIIWDIDFNLLQTIMETSYIYSLCNISSSCSFAVGLDSGDVKIYSMNENTHKYVLKRVFDVPEDAINCLLYMPKHDLLLSGSEESTLYVYELSKEEEVEYILKFLNFNDLNDFPVDSLIFLSDDMFASGHRYSYNSNDCEYSYTSESDGDVINGFAEIKIWQFNNFEKVFECIKTIYAYDTAGSLYLNILGSEFLISSRLNSKEIKIWDLKSYECLKTYIEDSEIIYNGIIVTKRNNFFTTSNNNTINLWKIEN